MKVTLNVITKFSLGGVISQELIDQGGRLKESHRVLMRSVIDTREKHVREALIKLGWTPPKGV